MSIWLDHVHKIAPIRLVRADGSAIGGELNHCSRESKQTAAVVSYVVVRVFPRCSRFRSEISNVRRMCGGRNFKGCRITIAVEWSAQTPTKTRPEHGFTHLPQGLLSKSDGSNGSPLFVGKDEPLRHCAG